MGGEDSGLPQGLQVRAEVAATVNPHRAGCPWANAVAEVMKQRGNVNFEVAGEGFGVRGNRANGICGPEGTGKQRPECKCGIGAGAESLPKCGKFGVLCLLQVDFLACAIHTADGGKKNMGLFFIHGVEGILKEGFEVAEWMKVILRKQDVGVIAEVFCYGVEGAGEGLVVAAGVVGSQAGIGKKTPGGVAELVKVGFVSAMQKEQGGGELSTGKPEIKRALNEIGGLVGKERGEAKAGGMSNI